MYALSKLGFNQSYNYFPWRNDKAGLTEFLTELSQTELREYFRANLWPNTPDILTEYLQHGGAAAFQVRLILAATLGSSYGIYGPAFERMENQPLRQGSEEYLNSEKYEIRDWPVDQPGDLSALVTQVNRIRHDHPALHVLDYLDFHPTDNPQLIAYSKTTDDWADVILVVANLDPHNPQSGWVDLTLEKLALQPLEAFTVEDLLTGERFTWHGSRNYVTLDPRARVPAHIFQDHSSREEDHNRFITSWHRSENTAAKRKNDPLWYKKAVIYQAHVRSFCDSDANGIGDFRGLTSKLDYLQDLGVTALWLLPFYPSPLRDDGYDIANYCDVNPIYGDLADFREFLDEAHTRGLRVITELVINHTSDQHEWFQKSRRAQPGTKWRDFYVWSDTQEKYKDARIIFKDFELSNWTWDSVAGAHFWHRFYSHQPDLNFDNPEVHDELFKVLEFWLDMGVDGLRLDAVPYLYERENTNCENLEETHQFLKKLRAHMDAKYGDRMLLAEANQWPEDAAAYFGQGRGDECHVAFHFPLMPRLFMSVRMEDRTPIVDILQQTPAIPETSQWAIFLRNHDELTLEMVTDEERDYMYRVYAQDARARINLGIRRRLAPLLGNDRRRIELLNALLLSMPGTPVLYYGDEIGMGDNVFLGDRNGVRTPMQWSSDKNAGFSRANPQSLFLPIILDPEYHYEAVNVENQQHNPDSLLWWTKRLLAMRKRWPVFGTGSIDFLQPENRKILAFIRREGKQCVLVVCNLSRFVEVVELNLSPFQQMVPVEIFSRNVFPPISDQPYRLTIGPHAFYWFSLESVPRKRAWSTHRAQCAGARMPLLEVEQNWAEVLEAPRFGNWRPSFRSTSRPPLVWRQEPVIKNVRITETIAAPCKRRECVPADDRRRVCAGRFRPLPIAARLRHGGGRRHP